MPRSTGRRSQLASVFSRRWPPSSGRPTYFCTRIYIPTRGLSAKGRADIEHSLRLDGQDAYAHRNLGIYYFDQGDYAAALPHFERAHCLGTAPPELAAYLWQTRQQLGLPAAGEQPPSEN